MYEPGTSSPPAAIVSEGDIPAARPTTNPADVRTGAENCSTVASTILPDCGSHNRQCPFRTPSSQSGSGRPYVLHWSLSCCLTDNVTVYTWAAMPSCS